MRIIADDDFINELAEKGYLIEKDEEDKLYRNKYLDFIDERDDEEIQLFFVPNYSCNFACSYCYQDEYAPSKGQLNDNIIDSFFSYIQTRFAGKRKYITVFGGEPLLNSPKQKEIISYVIKTGSGQPKLIFALLPMAIRWLNISIF